MMFNDESNFNAKLDLLSGENRDLRIARSAVEAELSKLKRLMQEIADYTNDRLDTLVRQARNALNEAYCMRFSYESKYAVQTARDGNKGGLGVSIASMELAATAILDTAIELRAYVRSALSTFRSS